MAPARHTEPVPHTEPEPPTKLAAQAEPVPAEPAQAEPVQTEPVQTEPVQTEPAQARPAKAQPAQAKPSRGKRSGNDQVIDQIRADFDARLTRLAADPLQWAEFVDQVAVFGARYSLGNQILLSTQAEQRGVTPRYFLPFGNAAATTGWKAHGRRVRRGETGYRIWAPLRRRPTDEQAAQQETDGRRVDRDAGGRPVPQLAGFRLATVFELGQTDGEPFEPPTLQQRRRLRAPGGQLPQLLTGADPAAAFDDVAALITAHGYTVQLVAPYLLGGANGLIRTGPRLVQIRDDVDPAQQTKTAVHELAHLRCGHADAGPQTQLSRGRRETEAESVAHIVCAALGLDTAAYSDAYVLGWAGGDLALVRECAETVLRVARSILRDLDPGDAPVSDPAADDAPAGAGGCQPATGQTEAGEDRS